jgi:hypothetical protein
LGAAALYWIFDPGTDKNAPPEWIDEALEHGTTFLDQFEEKMRGSGGIQRVLSD